MASRALGASLALATAAAFVVSIASSAWWAGHPVVEGKEITAKHVFAGPLGATGCNTGGDGSCEPIAIASDIQLVGYGALGATALATIFAILLLFAASKVSDRRKGLALASLLFTLLAAGAGAALLALGPGIQASQHVEVPIGWGTFVFGGGVVTSLLASLVTRALEPEPLRLKSSRPAAQRQPAAPAPAAPSVPSQPPLHAPLAFAATLPAQPIAAVAPPPAMVAPPPATVAPPPATSAPHRAAVMPAQNLPAPLLGTTAPTAPSVPMPPAPAAPPLPGMSPAPPLPGMSPAPPATSPARAKAPSAPPPLRPPSPSEAPPRTKTPSAAGSDVFRPSSAASSTSGPGSGAFRPVALGSDALRPKSSSNPPLDAARPKSPSSDGLRPPIAPAAARPKSPSHAPPPAPAREPFRPKPPTGSPLDKRPIVPPPAFGATAKPPAGAPTSKGIAGVSPPDAAAKPLPGVPRPPARPSQPRIPTQHATPPPALPAVLGTDAGTQNRHTGSRPGIAVPPAPRNPTLATAVPPPPSDTDGKPSTAPGSHASTAPKSRADTDARTGKNRIVDVTETGIPAAPPRASTDIETADGVRETTAQTLMAPEPPPPRDPEDLLKTFEQNPKSFDQSAKPLEPSTGSVAPATALEQPKTPIPTLERTTGAHVPISTAPSTLPPPKQLDDEPSGPSPACPQCEAPMAWVDEHLRFYCKQCRMYF